jgi:hypothetical protein
MLAFLFYLERCTACSMNEDGDDDVEEDIPESLDNEDSSKEAATAT